jgi:hypothetical protein
MAKIVLAAVTLVPVLSMIVDAPPLDAVLRQTLVTTPLPVFRFTPVVMFSVDWLGTLGRNTGPVVPVVLTCAPGTTGCAIDGCACPSLDRRTNKAKAANRDFMSCLIQIPVQDRRKR